jgi:ElaB/YqjD/DUF883 family membrane-anchored ribosome-binding protein
MTPSTLSKTQPAADTARNLVDQGARAAHATVSKTMSAANHAIDSAADDIADAGAATTQTLHRALDRTQQFGHHALEVVRDGSQQLRVKAQRATDASADYIRHEPIKSVLMAAAAGAALVVLGSLFARGRR